jgi:archaetidylinositol phosphate synthase
MAVGSSFLYYVSVGNRSFLWLAAALLLLSGFFDALDGSLARLYGKVAKFGGFCDSVIDKIGEMLVLSAITLAGLCSTFWGLWAISSSILVSYTRARGESEGANMTVGVAERPERLLILFASTLAEAINVGIIVISILASVTVAQRIYRAHRELS